MLIKSPIIHSHVLHFCILLLLACVSMPVLAQDFFAPAQAIYPGDVLTVYLFDAENCNSFGVSLEQAGKNVHSFKSYRSPADARVLISHIAVHSLIIPGKYELIGRWTMNNGAIHSSRYEIEVLKKDFLSETIYLNPSNTAIRTQPDPEKTRQLRIINNILSRWNSRAQVHLAPITVPVESPRLTSWYGDRRIYKYSGGGSATSDHKGLDYGAPTGTPIKAGMTGTVVFADSRITTGNTVVIEFGPGLFALYYHLHSISISTGMRTESDTIIGTVGATGLATGPHLHFEIQNQGVAVNPAQFFNGPHLDTMAVISLYYMQYHNGRW
jgi:hypothetical protein